MGSDAAKQMKEHGLNGVMPWFMGLSASAKKTLLLDGYELHTPDVLHSFGRLMRDVGIGLVEMCMAWRRRGCRTVFSNRIAEQDRFRPPSGQVFRTFPRVSSRLQSLFKITFHES